MNELLIAAVENKKPCSHPGIIKAGQRNNTNDYCPDCGWADES